MVKKSSQMQEYKYPAIIIGGSILISLLLVLLLGRPLWNSLTETGEKLKEKNAKLVNLTERLENLKKLKSKEAELREKNEKVLAALPTDKDVSRLFVQFENIASESGLTIKEVTESKSSTSTTEASAAVKEVSYEVKGSSGDYPSIRTAFQKFEQALRILSVSKIDVTKGTEDLSLSLTVKTFTRGTK